MAATLPNNLPLQISSFVGREREIDQVKRLLPSSRLVTLTGAGGCGKTRLAMAVGASLGDGESGALESLPYTDGVWFVALASLADPTLVPQQVAAALGVHEQAAKPLLATLTNFLCDKHLLLILDNCEQLTDACARVVESLLHACPRLTVLATSRERLNADGEQTYLVPSLELPTPKSQNPSSNLMQFESVRLFVARAHAANASFVLSEQNANAVARICQRLDGIPLAIELAAARVSALSVEQIAAHLDHGLDLLTGGKRTALPRHQTMRAAIDWSYVLLSEAERTILRRLSIFVDGWTLEGAEAVCADNGRSNELLANPLRSEDVMDVLVELVNKSLVLAEEYGGEARYCFLELIRQYAHEQLLASGEVERVRNSHLDFFVKFAEAAESQVHGPEQFFWFNRLERDHHNFRAALDWSLQSGEGRHAGLRIAAALERFWFIRNYAIEGLACVSKVLSRPEAAERSAARAKALNTAASMKLTLGKHTEIQPLIEESLAIGMELGDKREMARSFYYQGVAAINRADYETARIYLERALLLQREREDKLEIGCALAFIGEVALLQGEYTRAQTLYDEAVPLVRAVGDKSFLPFLLRRTAQVARHQGNYERAAALYKEGLGLAWEVRVQGGVAKCMAGLAGVAVARGQIVCAAKLLAVAEALLASLHAQLEGIDGVDYEHSVAAVRAQLDETTFAKAWAEGRAMTLAQALTEAEQITISAQPSDLPSHTPLDLAGLSAREVEVLRLTARGLSNAEIAETLVISVRTVDAHLRSIFNKLDVMTRTAAARVAMESHLV